MKRLIVALALFTSACTSTQGKSPSFTGPTVQADVVYDGSVAWSATEVGKVTVTNPRSTTLTLTFALWNYQTEATQSVLASAIYVLAPHETRVLTVGANINSCGLTIQRDLYEGEFKPGFTMSDVRNYLYAAAGQLWPATSKCVSPPMPPSPPPTCTDPKATNVGKPLPCTYLLPCKSHYGQKTVTPCSHY